MTTVKEFNIGDRVEVNGDTKTEIGRGHGHIIHEGAKGIAQASAYHLRRFLKR